MTTIKAKNLKYNDIFRVEGEPGLCYRGQEYDLPVGLRATTGAMIVLTPDLDVELVMDIQEIASKYIRQVESGVRPAALFDYSRGMNYREWKAKTNPGNGSVIAIEGMDGYFSTAYHSSPHVEALRSDGNDPLQLTYVHKIDLLAYGVDLARNDIVQKDKSQTPLASVLDLHKEQVAAGMTKFCDIEHASLIRVPREKGLFINSYRTYSYYGRRFDKTRELRLEWDEPVELIADIYDLANDYIRELEKAESQNEYFQPKDDPENDEIFPQTAYSLPGGTVVRIAGRRGVFYIQKRDRRILAYRRQEASPIVIHYDRIVEIIASVSDLAHWHVKRIGKIDNTLPAKDHDQEDSEFREFTELPSGCIIRIPGEDGLFYTKIWRNVESTARRWDNRSIFHLDYDLPVEIVFDVYDLAKLCLQRMETDSLPLRIMDSYPLYLEQPFIIRIAGTAGFYYTEIRKDESGLYVDRYECYARRGDEEILLTENIECEALLDMKDAAAQYVERFEESARYAQMGFEQSSPYLRAACGLSSGDVIRIPGETGLFYAAVSYYGQFAYREDESTVFVLKGDQVVEVIVGIAEIASGNLCRFEGDQGKFGRVKTNGSLARLPGRDELCVIVADLYETPYGLYADGGQVDLEWDQEIEVVAEGYDLAKGYLQSEAIAALSLQD